jgi:hypothetical protein
MRPGVGDGVGDRVGESVGVGARVGVSVTVVVGVGNVVAGAHALAISSATRSLSIGLP